MPTATVPIADATVVAPVPGYLLDAYWWAYVHPNAVRVFEREWLVNLILFGNYGRLRDSALAALGERIRGSTLQVACVYGDLTRRLVQRLAPGASLDVVDILPIQLRNLACKITPSDGVRLLHGDSASLPSPDAHYDQVLLFFLLHEQPAETRRATLAEAWRVVKPSGRIVIVDYHRPGAWHPLRLLMRGIFRAFEPYAMDFWENPIEAFMPSAVLRSAVARETFFGGLYQRQVVIR